MWTQKKFRWLNLTLLIGLVTIMVFICGVRVSFAGTILVVPATAEGTIFSANSAGTYRFMITSGAVQVCPPAAQPDHPEWWGWKTEVLIYKNRAINWSGGANAPEHPNPADWDFSVGDQAFQPTYGQAEQIGMGMYVDIPLQANDYVILVVNDSQGYFLDNSGGITFDVTLIQGATVRIKDPQRPTVIYRPVTNSPKIVLDTEVDPPGGTFNWQILSGNDKVRFVGSIDSEAAIIQGVAPSKAPNDVVVKVTYTVNSEAAEAVHHLTVQQPRSSRIIGGPFPDEHKENNQVYALFYDFQVYDQFVHVITGERMPGNEARKKTCSNHPIWWFLIPLISKGAPTNINGAWEDVLALPYYPRFPADFVGKVQQDYFVAGWPVGTYCQTYYSGYATSVPGVCGACR